MGRLCKCRQWDAVYDMVLYFIMFWICSNIPRCGKRRSANVQSVLDIGKSLKVAVLLHVVENPVTKRSIHAFDDVDVMPQPSPPAHPLQQKVKRDSPLFQPGTYGSLHACPGHVWSQKLDCHV
jgi:hypothetical protein